MYNFDYVKASSVADATAALGGDAQAISGGQTLIPTLKARLGQPSALVDLSGVAEMSSHHQERRQRYHRRRGHPSCGEHVRRCAACSCSPRGRHR